MQDTDSRTLEQRRHDARHADLTTLEREEARRRIAQRRAELTAELEILDAIDAGHRDALDGTE